MRQMHTAQDTADERLATTEAKGAPMGLFDEYLASGRPSGTRANTF